MVQGVGFLVNYHDSDEFGGAVAEGHPQVARLPHAHLRMGFGGGLRCKD